MPPTTRSINLTLFKCFTLVGSRITCVCINRALIYNNKESLINIDELEILLNKIVATVNNIEIVIMLSQFIVIICLIIREKSFLLSDTIILNNYAYVIPSYQVIKSIIHFCKPQAYNSDNKLSGHIINFYPCDSYRVRFALRYFTHILQHKNARRYLRACNTANPAVSRECAIYAIKIF